MGKREGTARKDPDKITAGAEEERGTPALCPTHNKIVGWVPEGHGTGMGPSGLVGAQWPTSEQGPASDQRQVPSSKLGHRANHKAVRTQVAEVAASSVDGAHRQGRGCCQSRVPRRLTSQACAG